MQKIDVISLLETVNLDFPKKNSSTGSTSSFGDILSSVQNEYSEKDVNQNKPAETDYNKSYAEDEKYEVENKTINDNKIEHKQEKIESKEDKKTESKDETKNEKVSDKKDTEEVNDEKSEIIDENIQDEDTSLVGEMLEKELKNLFEEINKLKNSENGTDNSEKINELLKKVEEKINDSLKGELKIELSMDNKTEIKIDLKDLGKKDLTGLEDKKEFKVELNKSPEKIIDNIKEMVSDKLENSKNIRNSKSAEKMHLVKLQVSNETKETGEVKPADEVRVEKRGNLDSTDIDELADNFKKNKETSKLKTDTAVENKKLETKLIDIENLKLNSMNKKSVKNVKIAQELNPTDRKILLNTETKASDAATKGKGMSQLLVKEGNMVNVKTATTVKTQRTAPVEQFLNNLKQVKKTTKLTVNLWPRDLGKITLDLTVKGESLVANFKTETAEAKDSLQTNIHALREALTDKGFNTETLEFNFQSYEESTEQQKQGNSEKEEQDQKDNDEGFDEIQNSLNDDGNGNESEFTGNNTVKTSRLSAYNYGINMRA